MLYPFPIDYGFTDPTSPTLRCDAMHQRLHCAKYNIMEEEITIAHGSLRVTFYKINGPANDDAESQRKHEIYLTETINRLHAGASFCIKEFGRSCLLVDLGDRGFTCESVSYGHVKE